MYHATGPLCKAFLLKELELRRHRINKFAPKWCPVLVLRVASRSSLAHSNPRWVAADAGVLFSQPGDRQRRGAFRVGGANLCFRESFRAFLCEGIKKSESTSSNLRPQPHLHRRTFSVIFIPPLHQLPRRHLEGLRQLDQGAEAWIMASNLTSRDVYAGCPVFSAKTSALCPEVPDLHHEPSLCGVHTSWYR